MIREMKIEDYDQVYEYLRDRILIADDFYYLADE